MFELLIAGQQPVIRRYIQSGSTDKLGSIQSACAGYSGFGDGAWRRGVAVHRMCVLVKFFPVG